MAEPSPLAIPTLNVGTEKNQLGGVYFRLAKSEDRCPSLSLGVECWLSDMLLHTPFSVACLIRSNTRRVSSHH